MKNSIEQLAEHSYYLSLDSAVKKQERCEEIFAEKKLKVEKFKATDKKAFTSKGDMLDTYQAQNKSIIDLLDDAIKKGYKSILVMEDDIEFTEDAEQVLADCLVEDIEQEYEVDNLDVPLYNLDPIALQEVPEKDRKIIGYAKKKEKRLISALPSDWDFFSLGIINNKYASTPINKRVHKIRYAILGHCWFIKSTAFEDLKAELEKMELPYDLCISKVFRNFDKYKAYAILGKGIAYQRKGYSDNLEKETDNSRID